VRGKLPKILRRNTNFQNQDAPHLWFENGHKIVQMCVSFLLLRKLVLLIYFFLFFGANGVLVTRLPDLNNTFGFGQVEFNAFFRKEEKGKLNGSLARLLGIRYEYYSGFSLKSNSY
jgi:hypothetical protein